MQGQSEIDSLQYILKENPLNLLSTKLDKQLNTYYLSSKLFYNRLFGKISFDITEDYNSTFIKSADRSIRDEQFFSTSAAYNIAPFLSLGLMGNNTILSDNGHVVLREPVVLKAERGCRADCQQSVDSPRAGS